jgi:hypothetical protein
MPFVPSERDLDLIQLEELHADSGYAEWFAERIGLPGWYFVEARHSVSSMVAGIWGETDLLAIFEQSGVRAAVMIEDKIAAAFTPAQGERYHERGKELVANGVAASYLTVLVAPRSYLASVRTDAPWQTRLALEDVADWFEGRDGRHFSWRAAALRRALARISRTASAGTEEVSRLSLALADYLARFHGQTLSHKPGVDKAGPTLRYPGTTVNKTLWWKFATNQMTLQLMGPYQGLVRAENLPPGMSLQAAAGFGRKCDYVVIDIPTVDLSQPLDAQVQTVESAVDAAKRLVELVSSLDVTKARPRD